jgi:cobalt-zinc-cadmium resistance protein CzcA
LYGVSESFYGLFGFNRFPVIWRRAYKNKVNVANKEKEVQENLLSYQTQVMATDKKSAIAEMEKNMALLSFETSGLQQSKGILPKRHHKATVREKSALQN